MLSLFKKIVNPSFKQLYQRFTSGFNNLHSVCYEPFLNGTSCTYIEELYRQWQLNPKSVHFSWHTFFKLVDNNVPPGLAYQSPIAAMTQLKLKPIPKPVPRALPQKIPSVKTTPAATPSVSKNSELCIKKL